MKLSRTVRLVLCAATVFVLTSIQARAHAGTIFANLYIYNNSNYMIPISSSDLGGVWSKAPNPSGEVENGDGSPVKMLAGGQTMAWGSASNGGILPNGTGGKITLTSPLGTTTTIEWSVPWCYFNGCGGDASVHITGDNGVTVNSESCNQNNTCLFTFTYSYLGGYTTYCPNNATNCSYTMSDNMFHARGSANDRVTSPDGRFQTRMQTDGNLVLYDWNNNALWASNTWNTNASYAVMQEDGNFVLYDWNGKALWSSGTWGNPDAFLSMQSDGNLVIYAVQNLFTPAAIWATNTCCR